MFLGLTPATMTVRNSLFLRLTPAIGLTPAMRLVCPIAAYSTTLLGSVLRHYLGSIHRQNSELGAVGNVLESRAK
jgi:hypothetical protein